MRVIAGKAKGRNLTTPKGLRTRPVPAMLKEALAGAGDVLVFQPEMSSESVRKLCDAILSTCGGRCAVFAGADGAYKYAIGISAGDLRPLVKELNGALQGRGGGKPTFVQGSVSAAEADIRAFFAE